MGIARLRGRLIDEADTADRPPVTVVNRALARKYFGTDDVVGRRIKYGRPGDDSPWVRILGVVGDAKQDGLADAVRPQAFDPIASRPFSDLVFAVRTAGDPRAAAADARAAVQRVDRALVLTDVRTLEDIVRASVGDERFRAALVSGFALAALLLAALGVYGVLAYFVAQRSREIGIRLALGARPASVVIMVLSQGARAVVPGIVAGLIGAWLAAGLLRSLLFGIERLDAPTYVGTAVLVGALAAIASVAPALRAARVDPMTSIRHE